ncbi:phage phieco32-like cooH.nH2 ligase-type [Caudoviricetes sp.]|nr:phage phieco32-like cooH.nH2 ligase-type [Caudoviricetes sp.]
MLNTIGSDMECFGMNKVGQHIALCGKIGGSKEQPLQIETLPEGFMIQEDNVALEFNIPICKGEASFIQSISIMRQHAQKILKNLNLLLSPEASMSFAEKELTHPNALVFGCEPDYDAWSRMENNKPQAKDANLRTCGGHIHVGSNMDMVQGVRNMDLFLGVPSILIDDKPSSIARRELYGKAGAMRPKPYGWEYRTLSNFWMFEDRLVSWVYKQTKKACMFNKTLTKKEGARIQKCINSGNKEEAQILVNEYGLILP